MAVSGSVKASVFSVKAESTSGEYEAPASGSDFVPLRPKSDLKYEPEQLESDELLNDIGASKSAVGKSVVTGSHSAYLKHSGVEGQEPEVGIFYESLFGTKYIVGTEKTALALSTTTVIKVTSGGDFRQGQALLVKKASGYKIVNVASISGNDLTVNFALDSAPPATTLLGKAVEYIPASSGHPTFSTTKYLGNGHAIETSAGNTTTEATFKLDANGYAEVEFAFTGTKYYFNPIEITASSKYIDVTDDSGTFAVQLTEGFYSNPVELADAIAAALNASSTEDYTCTFSSTDGKFTIASATTATLSLLWNSGANTANSAKTKLGFNNTDDTGALTYSSDNAQTYTAPFTPTYDDDNKIVVKDAEMFIGSQTDNVCFCAQTVSLKISKTVEDVDCICEESGILEKVPTARLAEMEIVAVLKKHDVALLDALIKNNGISAMMNCGPKSGGNWIPGKCFNSYLQKCTVSKYTTQGESVIQVSIGLKGYVTSTEKDVFINFI